MNLKEQYISRCLELAGQGLGNTAPNPMVGCLIVRQNEIIGEGFTSPYGGNHAEVNAINSVKDPSLLTDSTLYVSLEPCAHFGKTPPCADLIVKSGVPKVVIGCQDSFSEVNGAGIARLKDAGIKVEVGVLEQECQFINRRFFTFHEKKRPYIILKWAETFDGFVDDEKSCTTASALKITGETANILVHKWRSEEQAIMVGKQTVLMDNPNLTTRKYEGGNPLRIVLDSNLETDSSNNLLDGSVETVIFNSKKNEVTKKVEYARLENTSDFNEMLYKLHKRDIQSVLIEGGPTIHRAFYKAGLWDEIRRFQSATMIKKGVKALQINEEPEWIRAIGSDKLYTYMN
jgi:diaminohydroxyphosphoribosylaminopyrimidine deaminase/5-amino-6-(5-phosphoribosylamino)uracil reductase